MWDVGFKFHYAMKFTNHPFFPRFSPPHRVVMKIAWEKENHFNLAELLGKRVVQKHTRQGECAVTSLFGKSGSV